MFTIFYFSLLLLTCQNSIKLDYRLQNIDQSYTRNIFWIGKDTF